MERSFPTEQEKVELRFGRNTPLLYALPEYERLVRHRSENDMVSMKKEWKTLALPMAAYRVILLLPKVYRLNLFQTALLRLIGVRSYSDREMAELLCLDVTLIAFVMQQLKDMGLVSSRRITEKGEKVLHEEPDQAEYRDGFLFYDFLSNSFLEDFMPAEHFKLYQTDAAVQELRFNPTRQLAVDRSKTERTALLLNAGIAGGAAAPQLEENSPVLRRACDVIYKRFYYEQNEGEEYRENEETQEVPSVKSGVKLRALAAPEPVYAAVGIFKDPYDRRKVSVTSPCTVYPSQALTKAVTDLTVRPDQKKLTSLIASLGTEQKAADNRLRASRDQQLEKHVTDKLRQLFSDAAQKPEGQLLSLLTEACCSYCQLRSNDAGKNKGDEKEILDTYKESCYEAAGALMQCCISASVKRIRQNVPDFRYSEQFSGNPGRNQEMLCELAKNKLGFLEEQGAPWRVLFSGIKPESIRSPKRLGQFLAINVMLTEYDPAHPFLKIGDAPERKQALSDLFEIKEVRDRKNHGNGGYYAFEEIVDLLPHLLRLSAWMLGVPHYRSDTEEALLKKGKASDSEMQFSRAMREAGIGQLQKNSINTSANSKLVDNLITCYTALYAGKKRIMILEAAIFVENVVKYFSFETDESSVEQYIAMHEMDEPAELMQELCRSMDCLPEKQSDLRAFYLRAGVLCQKRRKVCSKALFDSMISAVRNPDSMFARFIRGNKQFIADLCMLHVLRGHGGENVPEHFEAGNQSRQNAEQLLERLCEDLRTIQRMEIGEYHG